MTRVSEQGQRVCRHPENGLHADEPHVQEHPDGECAPKVSGDVTVTAGPGGMVLTVPSAMTLFHSCLLPAPLAC